MLLFLFLQVLSRYVSLEAYTAASLVGENNYWKGLGNQEGTKEYALNAISRLLFSSTSYSLVSLILCLMQYVFRFEEETRRPWNLEVLQSSIFAYFHICA